MEEINFELFDDDGNFRQQLEMPTPVWDCISVAVCVLRIKTLHKEYDTKIG